MCDEGLRASHAPARARACCFCGSAAALFCSGVPLSAGSVGRLLFMAMCLTHARAAPAALLLPHQLLEHSQDIFLIGNANTIEYESASVQRTFGRSMLGCACSAPCADSRC
jgi:hypothetical protein